jgi:hypothetical protein
MFESRRKTGKPTHASLLDISSIGLSDSDNDDSPDDDNAVSVALTFPSPRRRGVSLPPESPPETTPAAGNLSLPLRRTTSMSRDTSPSSECKVNFFNYGTVTNQSTLSVQSIVSYSHDLLVVDSFSNLANFAMFVYSMFYSFLASCSTCFKYGKRKPSIYLIFVYFIFY